MWPSAWPRSTSTRQPSSSSPGSSSSGSAHPVDGRNEPLGLLREAVHLARGNAVPGPVRSEPLGIALAPRLHALVVVLAALENGRAGEPGDVPCAADVVGMHVRDHDPFHRGVELVEHRTPARLRIAGTEPRVDEDPAAARGAEEVAVNVVDAEGQIERHSTHTLLHVDHA